MFPKEYHVTLLIPYNLGSIYNTLKEKTTVLDTEYLNEGIKVTAVVSEYYYNIYKEYLVNNL